MRRRWLCITQIGALLAVFCCGVASANMTAFDPPAVDLSASLFAQCFGESSDRVASFSAASGDATAESPLRDLALRFDPQAPAVAGVQSVNLPYLSARIFATPAFDAPVAMHAELPQMSTALRAPVIEYYQSAAPQPTDAPLSHRFALGDVHVTNNAPSFQLAPSDVNATLAARGASVDVPLQLGRVRFSPHAAAGFSDSDQNSIAARSLAAGATLDVRAGVRNLGVDLSSSLEHVTLAQPQYSTSTGPSVGLSGEALPVFVPAYADVSAKTISTGVTVPVTRSLTANVQYDTQHLLGGYGTTPGLTGLDANNTIYGAQLTFKLPRSSSAISLSARQFHYQDNLVPSNAVTQTNAALNYTVKF